MKIKIQEIAIGGGMAKLIGEAEGKIKEIDLKLSVFEDFCKDNPDKTYPFEILLTVDPETEEPTIYMVETL